LYKGVKMISHQQKDRKQAGAVKLGGVHTSTPGKKAYRANGSDMTIDPELDKFSGDEFIPEKHKEAESRLTNSLLPPFK
jgi:hypothetical protein